MQLGIVLMLCCGNPAAHVFACALPLPCAFCSPPPPPPAACLQALPGAACQLTSLTIRPLLGLGATMRWSQLGSGLSQLASLALTADLGTPGPPDALGALVGLTRLRLHGAAAARGMRLGQEVGPALLAVTTGLRRLELGAVSVRHWDPAPAVEMGGAVEVGGGGGWQALPPAAADVPVWGGNGVLIDVGQDPWGAGILDVPGLAGDTESESDDEDPPGLEDDPDFESEEEAEEQQQEEGDGAGEGGDAAPPPLMMWSSDDSDEDEPPGRPGGRAVRSNAAFMLNGRWHHTHYRGGITPLALLWHTIDALRGCPQPTHPYHQG